MAGVVLGSLAVATASDDGPTLCPFALVTGMACPGCGMTRAVGRLVRGDLAGAIGYHPLVILVVVLAVVGGIWYLGRRRYEWPPLRPLILNAGLAILAIGFLAVWFTRLASGTLPVV